MKQHAPGPLTSFSAINSRRRCIKYSRNFFCVRNRKGGVLMDLGEVTGARSPLTLLQRTLGGRHQLSGDTQDRAFHLLSPLNNYKGRYMYMLRSTFLVSTRSGN